MKLNLFSASLFALSLSACEASIGSDASDFIEVTDRPNLTGTNVFTSDAVDVPKNIPDNKSTGVISQINVPTGLTLGEEVRVTLHIAHPHRGDLKVTLRSPQGVTKTIIARNDPKDANDDVTGTFSMFGGFTGSASGAWTLRAMDLASGDTGSILSWSLALQTTPICGNGQIDLGEECDDGNTNPSDDCTSDCTEATCGDGFVLLGVEACDDGNIDDNDGCDALCELECGNGILNEGEACDDGNAINDDACSNSCETPRCGDAILHSVEQCDDGNNTSNDGCSSACVREVITFFSDTFEVVNPGITFNNTADSAVKWQYDTQRAASGTTSLYFGNVATRGYADGDKTIRGEFSTPSFTAPQGIINVSFDIMKLTEEGGPGITFDQVTVNLLNADGGIVSQGFVTNPTTTGAFEKVQIPLQGIAGQSMRVSVVFDSLDGVANNGEGVYIDNLTVSQN